MLLDANILLYALDERSPHHERSRDWVEGTFNGDQRVGLPWQTIGAVARIATHPRIMVQPLTSDEVSSRIDAWMACPVVWVPAAGERTARILTRLLRRTGATGNLVPDAQLAALAIEHGLQMVSSDTDFARFPEVSWFNPLAS
ncbi:MAG: TA system VapC family ribonuclease toxin [Ornithinimicrobium sp.]